MNNIKVPDEGVIASAARDNVRVDIEYIGEGWKGDYDENDPTDEPLLRFSVYKDDEQVDDASYCTSIRADVSREYANTLARFILDEVYCPVRDGYSVKKLCEALSWVS